MGTNRKQQYSSEYKQDAVNYVESTGKSVDAAAKDLKIAKSTLGKWVRDAQQNDGAVVHRGSGNYSSDVEKENARLKKELRDAKDAIEILKKAMSILNN